MIARPGFLAARALFATAVSFGVAGTAAVVRGYQHAGEAPVHEARLAERRAILDAGRCEETVHMTCAEYRPFVDEALRLRDGAAMARSRLAVGGGTLLVFSPIAAGAGIWALRAARRARAAAAPRRK